MYVFLALGVAPLAGQDIVGEITYLEGHPEIVRDGGILHDTLDFGFAVQNYDAIQTDGESLAELRIDPSTGIDAAISVRENTQFTVQLSSLLREQTGTIELIAGSIGVIARELAGRSRLNIRTHSSVAGVRGTTFDVSTAVDGSVLVTTRDGLVEVTSRTGRALFAAPGEAVEVDDERGLVRNVRYAVSGAEFRQLWIRERADAFAQSAPRVLRFYGRLYLDARSGFANAYRELMGQRDVIDKWIEESRKGVTGGASEVIREKRILAGPLLRIGMAMFEFEHTLVRLERMRPYVQEVLGEVDLPGGITAETLYQMLDSDRALARRRVATVRNVLKLYALRNGGETPFDVFTGFARDTGEGPSSEEPAAAPGKPLDER